MNRQERDVLLPARAWSFASWARDTLRDWEGETSNAVTVGERVPVRGRVALGRQRFDSCHPPFSPFATVAELVDALALGASDPPVVWVRIPSVAVAATIDTVCSLGKVMRPVAPGSVTAFLPHPGSLPPSVRHHLPSDDSSGTQTR